MDSEDDEIPIQNQEEGDPFIDEISEGGVEESADVGEAEVGSELSEDIGGYNEVPLEEESNLSFDLGDSYIVLLESRSEPFLAKIAEISTGDNLLLMTDDNDKTLSFQFDGGEIIMKTEGYEILDMIRVRPYSPEQEDTEYKEMEFETEELFEKKYSDLAIKDDLLSSLIQSMNIYGNESLIGRVQETVDIFLDLIKPEMKTEKSFAKWLIPIIEDNLKLYDEENTILQGELRDELLSSENYYDYINGPLKFQKPIVTVNGFGLETDEYSGNYLRNCLQDDNCSGILGAYRYDERINSKPILHGDSVLIPSNRLRFIGLLEEPYNETVYSVNPETLSGFTVFEKYLYENLNRKMIRKKRLIKDSLIVHSEDDHERREKDKFIIHQLSDKDDISKLHEFSSSMINENIELLLSDDINESFYNYDDIEKILFKYEVEYGDLSFTLREKITSLVKENINRYHKSYLKNVKKNHNKPFQIKKISLTEERKSVLAKELISGMTKKKERNNYLQNYIDLFTRPSDKITESSEYLYNKYNDEQVLCKHYLYEVNITNDNDLFATMKSKYGLPPEDGFISCKVCGGYLCHEDTTLIDGYEGDKPMITRETIVDTDSKLMIEEYLSEKEGTVKTIKLISGSIGIVLTDSDIYDILLSYELLDHNTLADVRYDMLGVVSSDIHPRVNKEIQKIKELEKKEKDKKKKKELKERRENTMKKFQGWLKDTNIILILTSLISLYVQTAVPSYFIGDKGDRSIEIIDVIEKKINKNVLKYLSIKIRRLSEKYEHEKIWKHCIGLFNEKEHGSNEIETQLGLTVQMCMQPNFPMIITRITNYEEFVESSKHDYLKEEWEMFRPLKQNTLVNGINLFLDKISDANSNYYRKVYGGTTVENNSLIRPLKYNEETSVSKLLDIPEIGIFKNSSFRTIFRYVVSLYGKRPSNLFITLTFNRLLDTCDKPEEILAIMKQNGWSSSSNSFKILDFVALRKKVIPEILSLYGDKNTEINSCYTNEKACNSFIHNAINTYDLSLLNTKPKRIYFYRAPVVYPILPYGRLNEYERYDSSGKQIKNVVDMVFENYKYNDMNQIAKKTVDNFYPQFLSKIALSDKKPTIKKEEFKNIENNEENFYMILETNRQKNSLLHLPMIHAKDKYTKDDYSLIERYSSLENRFYEYIKNHLSSDSSDSSEKQDIGETLINIFEDYLQKDELDSNIDLRLRNIFSSVISENNENVERISKFLARSDEIEVNQKKRFESIFREYNPGQRISFKSEQISSILNLFLNDVNLKYKHLKGYMMDIRNIMAHLCNDGPKINMIPKEWKATDAIADQYQAFMERDGNSVHLLLHNKIFTKSKDNYIGFNRYINDDKDNIHYFRLLFRYLKPSFDDLDKLKGQKNSKYSERYSDIYMKFHFMNLFDKIVHIIEELKDSQSEITSDANDLFQSLERVDSECTENMIEVYSQFLMDLLTHVLFQHYDPSWLFLNEQKLDLSNRLSKQKEREKQVLVGKLDSATREERFAIMQKQKMGISLFYKQGAAQASEYVKSDEHASHNEDERIERLKDIMSQSNVELDVMRAESEEVEEIPQSVYVDPTLEEEGYVDYDEYDPEDETYGDEGLDGEQEAIFNE